MVFRSDYITVGHSKIDSNGYLKVNATIARVGVQEYPQADGTIIREFRPPEEVEKSVATFEEKPITIDHPGTPVTADNAGELLKGLVKYCNFDGNVITSRLIITHADAVDIAVKTHKQLSCGYNCDLEDSPGIWVDSEGLIGEKDKAYPYDKIQRNIVGNHVALVQKARAGAIASIHLDSLSIINQNDQEKSNMPKIHVHKDKAYQLDSIEEVLRLVEALGLELDGYKQKIDVYEKEMATIKPTADSAIELKIKADSLAAEVDALKIQKQELEEKVSTKTDSVSDESIKKRLEMWSEVLPVIKKDNADFTPDYSLDESGISKLYLSMAYPHLKEKLDSESADYARALWDLQRPSVTKSDSTQPLKNALFNSDSVQSKPVDLPTALAEKRAQNFKSDMKKGA
jgi:hypothetical protein